MKHVLRRFALYWIALGMVALGALCLWLGVFQGWNWRLTDHFFLSRVTDEQVVIVAIDDASIEKIGRWPWGRDVHARLIQTLSQDGALAIGYDVNFPEASDVVADQTFAQALTAAHNVYLPQELAVQSKDGVLGYDPAQTVQPIDSLRLAAAGLAFTNVPLDSDSVARRVPLVVGASGQTPSAAFAYALASVAGRAPATELIPKDAQGNMVINFAGAPNTNFKMVSADQVLSGAIDPSVFRGKIVLVGATARNLHDMQIVPSSDGQPMSGVELHASIFDTIANQRWLQDVPFWVEAILMLALTFGLALLVKRVRARYSLLVVALLLIGLLVSAFILFDQGLLLNVVWPMVVLVVSYVAFLIERWVVTEQQRRQTRHAFSRYVSSNVVDALLKHPDKLKLGGERRRMTVMFSDLRGFTTLSEGLAPEQLVEVLNTYLHEMTSIVFEQQGVLDKYIGDAVMAFWNAPFDQPDHAVRAVRAAIKMRDRLKAMNAAGVFPPGIELKVGIGANTGEMVVGNIGGEDRYDYTVIGDSVNLASRTEGLCKEYGVEIIVTQSTRNELGDAIMVRKLDQVAVKGKKEPIMIYQVVCDAEQGTEELRRKVNRFEEALQSYFDQAFEQAIQQCQEILDIWPDDVPTQNLKTRCEEFIHTPPPLDWDGTWVMKKK